MSEKKSIDHSLGHNDTPVSSPPQYFDAEPSLQPPPYNQKQTPRAKQDSSQQSIPSTGAPAASIAAVLGPAPPPARQRTWRQRWKDWTSSEGIESSARNDSRAEWNYFGVGLSQFGGLKKADNS